MKTSNKILTILLLWLIAIPSWADGVNFKASAPNTVVAGQPFRLVYSVNDAGSNLRIPSLNGFEILAGPFTSQSTSMVFTNNQSVTTKEFSYTYTLRALKEGTYTIASASIVVNGQKYTSKSLTIKVLPEDQAAQVNQNQGQRQNSSRQPNSTSTAGSADRLFVKAHLSRTKVMEQEAVLLTYKLYTKDNYMGMNSVKLPDFKGFVVQEIEQPNNQSMKLENYNGQNYNTAVIYQAILFPQHSGTISIAPFTCEAVIAVPVRTGFFSTVQSVSKNLSTGKTTVTVDPLPQPKPAGFSGVVGTLSIDTKVSSNDLETNKPVTVTVTIRGAGNLKMLKTPELQFPKDFETYEPKVTNHFTTSTSGQQGSKTIEYLAIPRHKGEFTIPAASISYFDLTSKSYKTLSTTELHFNITKGSDASEGAADMQNVQDQERVEMLAKDIRYLNSGKLTLTQKEDYIVNTLLFWLCYLAMIVVTVALLIFFRKKIRDNANIALRRTRGANKVARRRLKVADREWRSGHKENFYDEILKALWGYTSDKLSIPLADLNKDTMTECLTSKGVNAETIAQFTDLLNECEFQRYAPTSDANSAMEHTYRDAVNLISKFEDTVRR